MMPVEYNVYGTGSSQIMSYKPDEDGVWRKHYYIRDHLGNLRATLLHIGGAIPALVSQHDYEALGERLDISAGLDNRTGFIGKERDAESALGDHGVRKY